jgi:site-specific recombinase XerD
LKAGQVTTTAHLIFALRAFLKFLLESDIVTKDFMLTLPQAHQYKLARIPSIWKQDDVEKLLAALDRGSPSGKRDYAILLTVVKMGLRTGDVFSLKKENINWEDCRIELTQQKTGEPISLPLQDAVGWAIIDYLKNARPVCDSPFVFVNHATHSLGKPLRRAYGKDLMAKCFRRARLPAKVQQQCGLHSLRHTLATRLLEAKTPLPVISEILGHTSSEAVEKYLKVDIESLRYCALDPEEVFANADNS